MTDKFSKIPNDPDTTISYSKEITLGEHEVLHQKWFWDGIRAESFIFTTEDISSMSNDDLENLAKTSEMNTEDTGITIVKSDSGYTFVNFNFKI